MCTIRVFFNGLNFERWFKLFQFGVVSILFDKEMKDHAQEERFKVTNAVSVVTLLSC